jgi:DNA-binding NtrC family response regulator
VAFATPRLILSVDFPDANSLLAGVLSLKGFKVFKSKSTNECLSIINQSEEKVDIILTDKESAVENDSFLLNEIDRVAPETMIVVIVDNDDDVRKLPKIAIEFVLRPTSADNLAHKILHLLAKRELKRLKDSCRPEYEINF